MKRILYFFAGTAIGAGVTYFITKSIFNEKLSKQSNEIYKYYEEKFGKCEEIVKEDPKYTEINNTPKAPVKPDISTIIQNYSAKKAEDPGIVPPHKVQTAKSFGPYVIDREFAGKLDYPLEDCTYEHYANDVITDAAGNPLSIEEIDQKFGANYEDFLEVDSDTTYFRNEELGMDFEIHDNGDEEYHVPTAGYVREDD
ncbi:MAG: hypothetical protein IKU67_05670 [Firmicutes bacterium]|nr:hypothetical protein [Bacillota bacterium]